MDTKGGQIPPSNLASTPLVEEDGVVYIAVKGSLHAMDCSIFGLGQEEMKAMTKKYPGSGVVVNGVGIKTNVIDAINSLSQLGYRIASSTGEAEITWTMLREC